MDNALKALPDPDPARPLRQISRRPYVVQWLILGIGLFILAGFTGYALYQERADLERGERDRLRTQAQVISENLGRQLAATDRALKGLRRDLPRWQAGKGWQAGLTVRLTALGEAMPDVRTLIAIDPDGIVRASNRESLVGISVGQREFFQHARERHDAETAYLSPPYQTVLGIWSVNISRVITGPKGEFAGLVTATLDPDYFRTLMASVQYAPDMWVGIAHGDGSQILMVPEREGLAGKNLAQPGSFFTRHMDSGREENVLTGIVYATGEERMMALRTIQPKAVPMDRPLVVAVGRDLDSFYAGWKQNAGVQGGVLFLVALGAILGLATYQARARRFDAQILEVQAAILKSNERFELLLSSAGEGIYGVDLESRIIFINPAALSMLGFDRDELMGQDQHRLFHRSHADDAADRQLDCPIFLTLADGVRREVEDYFIRKGGEIFPVHLIVTPMFENGVQVGAEAIFQDITRRKETERELLRLATTDPLTGIANRRRFIAQMEQELARIKRFGGPTTLLMLDLDHFKRVNDTLGHAAGDAVLRHFTALAESRLRRVDLLGRLGGEEFGILLPGTTLAEATDFAEHFCQQVAESPAPSGNGPISFTVSIGVAEFYRQDSGPDSILARADEALYRAKDGGRNRVELALP